MALALGLKAMSDAISRAVKSATSTKSNTSSSSSKNTSSVSTTSNKSSNSSSNNYNNTRDDFDSKYDAQIRGIANANNVDMSVGKEMFTANLNNSLMGITNPDGAYKGGGVVSSDDWNTMVNDWSNLKNSAIESTNQKGRTTTNSYGREINTSDLLPTGANYGNTTGSGDPKIDAMIRQQSGTQTTGLNTQQFNQPMVVNQGYNINDVNNMMGQMGTQFGDALTSMNNNLSNVIVNMGQSFGNSLESLAGSLGGLTALTRGMNGEEIYKTGNGSYLASYNGKAIEMNENEYLNYISRLVGF